MEKLNGFSFEPLPPLAKPVHFPFPNIPNPLGPLQFLPGTWVGGGFNTIWRPFQLSQGSDHFLELNLTNDKIVFDAINGPIPNRGLLQADINMFGITYTQEISDHNLGAGLHIEPGIWATVPQTTDPAEQPTVVRMASIPHGTTILAQGLATTVNGPPIIPDNDITPFLENQPANKISFPQESTLSNPSNFRSPANQLVGITQAMVNNPNSVLKAAISGQVIISTTTLQVSSTPAAPLTGGGTDNTSFLEGGSDGPNARSALVSATFWIEAVQGPPAQMQLQYSQTVLLNFNGLSWPHVTVGTLKQKQAAPVPIPWLDPTVPVHLLPRVPFVPFPIAELPDFGKSSPRNS